MLRSLSLSLAVAGVLLAQDASAQLVVYRGSPTCATNVTPGSIPINGGPTQVLVCYDDPGGGAPTTGQECVGGTADEVCGVDVEIRATGGVTITSYTPPQGSDYVFSQTPTLIKVNGGNPLTGESVPMALGIVTVSATAAGNLEVIGKHWVDSLLALQNIGPNALATAAVGADLDGDGIDDATDRCPTLANAGVDTDGDGVDNVCDTCTNQANAPIAVGTPVAANRTLVSRQFDDDADGRGNRCDFDYNQAGLTIAVGDFNDMKFSLLPTAGLVTQNTCGATAGEGGTGASQRCGKFDHDGAGLAVSIADFNIAKAAFQAGGLINTNFPKCPACNSPWSRPIGDVGGAPVPGRVVCESAVAPTPCQY